MLKLNLSTENERELAAGLPNAELADDAMLEEIGDRMTTWLCEVLADHGYEFNRVYTQSVGAHVILQSHDAEDELQYWEESVANCKLEATEWLKESLITADLI